MRLVPFEVLFWKCGKIWKNGRFAWRIWSDWENTALLATAGLGVDRVMNCV